LNLSIRGVHLAHFADVLAGNVELFLRERHGGVVLGIDIRFVECRAARLPVGLADECQIGRECPRPKTVLLAVSAHRLDSTPYSFDIGHMRGYSASSRECWNPDGLQFLQRLMTKAN
jgi:hypothetical protein